MSPRQTHQEQGIAVSPLDSDDGSQALPITMDGNHRDDELQQHSNSTSDLDITLQELIDSGLLSDWGVFSFWGEDNEDHERQANDETHDNSRHLLSAVKFSLLLAKEFEAASSSCWDAGDDDGSQSRGEEEEEEGEGRCSLSSAVGPEHVHVKMSSSASLGHQNNSNNRLSPVLSSGDNGTSTPSPSAGSPQTWTILSVSITRPPSVTQDNSMPNEKCDEGSIIIRHLGKLIYTVFSLGKKCPLFLSSSSPDADDKQQQQQQQDSETTTHVISDYDSDNPMTRFKRRGGGGVRGHPQSQSSTLFNNLVESGDYPLSICRLISDMMISSSSIDNTATTATTTASVIDDGHNNVEAGGDYSSPFQSCHEVIGDLLQMQRLPDIFLYDNNNYGAANEYFELVFGQRFYGQEREISQLLAISTGLEQAEEKGKEKKCAVPRGVEVVFVKGMAGVGKTHLVQRAGDFLSSFGQWIVVKTKFERGVEHGSRQCISSLFNKLLTTIVTMRDGEGDTLSNGNNEAADAEYSRSVTKAIHRAIDQTGLAALTGFIPSIVDLIPGADRTSPGLSAEGELKPWQLSFLLSKLMGALLSCDRFIMLCLDDLQWCDPVMLTLITEIIVHSGHRRWRCLCVGTYRSNEVTKIHPLMKHYNGLKANKNVNVHDIQLSSLTKSDVIDMVMTEMRLPRRFVAQLGEVVHKKTSGHCLFVVQLLNALVRDGNIAYSPRKIRYDYDRSQINSLKTWDSVASLIVSNLSYLSNTDLQNLRIVCCFGMQAHKPIIHLINGCSEIPSEGMASSLDTFVKYGILEIDGEHVSFTHDLIHQTIYDNMSVEHRQKIQLNIGTFLGDEAGLDKPDCDMSIEASIEKLHLSKKKHDEAASLAMVAVDLVNSAGLEHMKGTPQRIQYAGWNLHAASESKVKSNFKSALHYCKRGISFLGEDLWSKDTSKLSRQLHEAAAFASYAIGNTAETAILAEAIVNHVTLEQSIFAQLMILKALEAAEEHQHIIARGLAILRTLKFDIPSNPTPLIIMKTLIQTGSAASAFSIEQITKIQKSTEVNVMKRNILNLVGAVGMACYQTISPYWPLLTCAIVNYSLENGICEESAYAFAMLGYFQLYLQGNYESGKHWGDVAEKILDNSLRHNSCAVLALNGFLFAWFKPLGELAGRLFDLYETSMKSGDIDGAMYALCQYWRFSFYGGQKLSVLSLSHDKLMKLMVKYCFGIVKFVVLDISLTRELMGSADDPYSYFEGAILDEEELIQEAQVKNNNPQLQLIAFKQFQSAFHSGDYSEAALLSKDALSFPTSKTPKIQLIFHYFYHGLTSFYLHRNGEGESHLDEGKIMLEKLTEWHKHSPSTFENKLFLLQAEYFASLCNRDTSIEKYEASIKAARDNGFVHEQGIAHEFMGHYLVSIVEMKESTESFEQAYTCYMQWGAVAKAKRIQEDHHLCIPDDDIGYSSLKHSRDW